MNKQSAPCRDSKKMKAKAWVGYGTVVAVPGYATVHETIPARNKSICQVAQGLGVSNLALVLVHPR
jgi:hypothetical protein